MACDFDRDLLFDLLDGELADDAAAPGRAHLDSCGICRSAASRSARALALFLDAAAAEPPLESLRATPAFTARVMERVRSTPRAAPGTATPDAPPAPPALRVLPRPRRRRIHAAAIVLGGLAAAAVTVVVFHNLVSTPARNVKATPSASLVSLEGSALLAEGRNDPLSMGGWANEGRIVPSGGILHPLAPSTLRLALPGRGRLRAGPSTRLGLGPMIPEGDMAAEAPSPVPPSREVGVGDGWIELESGDGPWQVRTPAGVVTVSGAAEVATLASSGAGKTWMADYGAWAREAAVAADPEAPRNVPVPPGPVTTSTALFVRSRSGDVRIDAGNGTPPVTLAAGQALEVLAGTTRRIETGDDREPAWVSTLRLGSTVAGDTDPWSIASTRTGLPPAESIRATLLDTSVPGYDRALLLGALAGEDPARAVALALEVAEDPSAAVRSAVIRVLAMNVSLDRERILAVLRRHVADPDTATAVMCCTAIRTLGDGDAIPFLVAALAAEGDAPTLAGRVHCAVTLSELGYRDHLARAAALAPLVDGIEVLQNDLLTALQLLVRDLPAERQAALLADPSASIRAAALNARWNPANALELIRDPDPYVRRIATRVLIATMSPLDMESLRFLADDVPMVRNALVFSAAQRAIRDASPVPVWLVDVMEQVVATDTFVSSVEMVPVALLLKAHGRVDALKALAVSNNASVRALVQSNIDLPLSERLKGIADPDPSVAAASMLAVNSANLREMAPTEREAVIDALEAALATPSLAREAVRALGAAHAATGNPRAAQRILEAATSDNPMQRLGAAMALGRGSLPSGGVLLERLLRDSDREVATFAARSVGSLGSRSSWIGTPLQTLLESRDIDPRIRLVLLSVTLSNGNETLIDHLATLMDHGTVADLHELFYNLRIPGRTVPVSALPVVRSMALHHADAGIRLRALIVLPRTEREIADRAASGDPSVWVRIAAMAVLQEDGATEWEQDLKEKIALVSSRLDPSSDIAIYLRGGQSSQFIAAAELAAMNGMATEHYDILNAEALAPSLEALARADAVRSRIESVLRARNSSDRAGALRSLAEYAGPAVLRTLCAHFPRFEVGRAAASDQVLSDFLRHPLEPDPAGWFLTHPLGTLNPFEVDRR